MTLNIASSRSFGARPSFASIAASSSSVRPRARWSGTDGARGALTRRSGRGDAPEPPAPARSPGRRHERAQDRQPVGRPEERLGGPLRVGHEAGHVPGRVHHAGDRAQRAVRVGRVVRLAGRRPVGPDVAEQDPPVALEGVERRRVGVVAALAVGDRHPQRTALPDQARERRVEALRARSRPRGRRSAGPGCAGARRGRGPASARTWKPLQIPSTRPPSAANAATARITGLKRAMTPARR